MAPVPLGPTLCHPHFLTYSSPQQPASSTQPAAKASLNMRGLCATPGAGQTDRRTDRLTGRLAHQPPEAQRYTTLLRGCAAASADRRRLQKVCSALRKIAAMRRCCSTGPTLPRTRALWAGRCRAAWGGCAARAAGRPAAGAGCAAKAARCTCCLDKGSAAHDGGGGSAAAAAAAAARRHGQCRACTCRAAAIVRCAAAEGACGPGRGAGCSPGAPSASPLSTWL